MVDVDGNTPGTLPTDIVGGNPTVLDCLILRLTERWGSPPGNDITTQIFITDIHHIAVSQSFISKASGGQREKGYLSFNFWVGMRFNNEQQLVYKGNLVFLYFFEPSPNC